MCAGGSGGSAWPAYPEDAERPEGESEASWRLRAGEAIRLEGNELFKVRGWGSRVERG